MPNGGKMIISTQVDDKNEHNAAIRITDSGIGMSLDIQQKIFEPFFSTKQLGKGTGLGLSVVYGVVKAHGGSINFFSEMNKGTTFLLTFPLNKRAQEAAPLTVEKKAAGGSENVLIVDDEQFVRATLGAMLRELGYTVKVAESGKEALEILKVKSKFHLIILDMNMPEMTGKKVYQKIKKLNVPSKIIVSSGYSDEMLGKDSFAQRVDGFLQKPYKIEELARKLREVLD